jgi:hypothetical protein
MQKVSAKQFALTWAGMTVGYALILPAIPWLMPLGLAVCFASSFISRTEAEAARDLWRLFLVLALVMFQVMIQVTSGRGLTAPKDGPSVWWTIALAITWATCAVWDYRRWRASKGDDTHAA